jgi:hypothetical protein
MVARRWRATGGAAFWTKVERTVPQPIRKLTGWEPSFLAEAIDAIEAWRAMLPTDAPIEPRPTVIHWAQFELPFLRDLHRRDGTDTPFPLDIICLHSAAARLFPGLPRRNIRALAGHLGHSADMLRRARGHGEATAFVWRADPPEARERGRDDVGGAEDVARGGAVFTIASAGRSRVSARGREAKGAARCCRRVPVSASTRN